MNWVHVCWAWLLMGCVRPTEERVQQDLAVGKSQSPSGSRIHVDDGHAAVRGFSNDSLTLWASAPAFSATWSFASTASRTLMLEVQNTLHDSELSVQTSDNTPPTVRQLPTAIGTRLRWEITTNAPELQLAIAPPDLASRAPFRFAVLSDVQEAIDRVQDIYRVVNAEYSVRFLFGAGDLTERGTAEELERFQRELEQLSVPYYTTLGNHELGTNPPEYHRYFGRGSFSFVFHDVRFTLLDSGSASLDPTVYDWLSDWLDRGRSQVHVISMHIPPLDPTGVRNGAFASRNEAAKLLTRLASGKVDLTLYGHVHSYYAFDNAGIPAHISGGGGAIPERFDSLGRHFLTVDVDPERGIDQVRVVRVD